MVAVRRFSLHAASSECTKKQFKVEVTCTIKQEVLVILGHILEKWGADIVILKVVHFTVAYFYVLHQSK